MFELEFGFEVGTELGAWPGLEVGLEPEAVEGLESAAGTGLETGVGFGLELEPVVECGPGVAVRPELESGFVVGTGPESGD